jgi:glycolate oxidase iron-sulfur subunit
MAEALSVPPCENVSLLHSNYKWEDAPDEAKYSECVHCGMCLEACPTYQQTGLEAHSPRGRVYLIKSVAEGKMDLNEFFASPVNTCLDCRACETACPSGVQVGALIEEARGQLHKADPPKGMAGLVHKLFLHHLFPFPKRMHMLQSVLKLYQKSGLRTLAHQTGILRVLPSHLVDMEKALPTITSPPVLSNMPEWLPAIGPKRAKVAVLTGCVMDVVYSDINEATIRVLRQNGCEVWIPQRQRCCGALHVHAGDRDTAKKLAKLNIEAFLAEDVDAIIINAAGCGSTLKEYDELLRNDMDFHGRAEEFVHKVTDVSQFLVKLGLIPPVGSLDLSVTYHDACHLAHAQKVRAEPRQLLEAIPGLRIVTLPDSDRCCGSAGIYNITHPEMANQLLERKLNDIPSGCDAVAMGNPGCMMQFQTGVIRNGRTEQIVHTIQLLDWAYSNEGPDQQMRRE